jgi:hypothetical protein
MPIMGAYGYTGVEGTCHWCGGHVKRRRAFTGPVTLDRNKKPNRCNKGLAHARTHLGQRMYNINGDPLMVLCTSRSFVRDILPNDKPWKCKDCGEDHEGWRGRKLELQPPYPFCHPWCETAYALQAVREGVVLKLALGSPQELGGG